MCAQSIRSPIISTQKTNGTRASNASFEGLLLFRGDGAMTLNPVESEVAVQTASTIYVDLPSVL